MRDQTALTGSSNETSTRQTDADNATAKVHFYDLHPAPADMRAGVHQGLALRQKCLSPKYFYDAHGSHLFDAICELPEYYPTRTLARRVGFEPEQVWTDIDADSDQAPLFSVHCLVWRR